MAKLFRNQRSRSYLPPVDLPQTQAVTFRLADSLPELALQGTCAKKRSKVAAELDGNRGTCWLARHEIAQTVLKSLHQFNGSRYELIAWVVMPNHAHVIFSPYFNNSVSSIVGGWKRHSARRANELLGREGRFWAPDHFDHPIRDPEHLNRYIDYVHQNPVKAGLATIPTGWPHSSVHYDRWRPSPDLLVGQDQGPQTQAA